MTVLRKPYDFLYRADDIDDTSYQKAISKSKSFDLLKDEGKEIYSVGGHGDASPRLSSS